MKVRRLLLVAFVFRGPWAHENRVAEQTTAEVSEFTAAGSAENTPCDRQ